MKSYEQFASEMTPEVRARADALVRSIHEPWMDEPMEMLDRSRPTDIEHFKLLPLTTEEQATLDADLLLDGPDES